MFYVTSDFCSTTFNSFSVLLKKYIKNRNNDFYDRINTLILSSPVPSLTWSLSSVSVPEFTEQPSQLKGYSIHTRLSKGPRGFGFNIVGGSRPREFLQVYSVTPGGPPALNTGTHTVHTTTAVQLNLRAWGSAGVTPGGPPTLSIGKGIDTVDTAVDKITILLFQIRFLTRHCRKITCVWQVNNVCC